MPGHAPPPDPHQTAAWEPKPPFSKSEGKVAGHHRPLPSPTLWHITPKCRAPNAFWRPVWLFSPSMRLLLHLIALTVSLVCCPGLDSNLSFTSLVCFLSTRQLSSPALSCSPLARANQALPAPFCRKGLRAQPGPAWLDEGVSPRECPIVQGHLVATFLHGKALARTEARWQRGVPRPRPATWWFHPRQSCLSQFLTRCLGVSVRAGRPRGAQFLRHDSGSISATSSAGKRVPSLCATFLQP